MYAHKSGVALSGDRLPGALVPEKTAIRERSAQRLEKIKALNEVNN
jgi:hypothetical protein